MRYIFCAGASPEGMSRIGSRPRKSCGKNLSGNHRRPERLTPRPHIRDRFGSINLLIDELSFTHCRYTGKGHPSQVIAIWLSLDSHMTIIPFIRRYPAFVGGESLPNSA